MHSAEKFCYTCTLLCFTKSIGEVLIKYENDGNQFNQYSILSCNILIKVLSYIGDKNFTSPAPLALT